MSQTANQPSADPTADGVPPHRYTPALAQQIELAWQDRWEAEGTFHTPNPIGRLSEGFERVADRPKFFVMDMFPYPSGAGLHVGHPLGYLGTDVTSRFLRMDGAQRPAPDGLRRLRPARRAVRRPDRAAPAGHHRGQHRGHRARSCAGWASTTTSAGPSRRSTRATTSGPSGSSCRSSAPGSTSRRRQGAADRGAGGRAGRRHPRSPRRAPTPRAARGPSWTRSTRRKVVDAHRLAYLHQAPVNWCPGLGTVLSNEEVTADGRSERGNFPVFRRPLTQWMMRITAYADRLLDDLDRLDWSDSLKLMQRNWIGRSTGARIGFSVRRRETDRGLHHPARHAVRRHLHGAGAGAPAGRRADRRRLARRHRPALDRGSGDPAPRRSTAYQRQASRRSELDRQTEGRDKTGVWLGVTAVNPVNGRELPVFIADYVLTGYGTGAIMAVPGEDVRDFEFAEKFGLPVVRTVQPPEGFDGGAYTGAGPMINSANDEISLNGLDKADGDRDDHRVAGRARPRRGDHHLQAARLAVQPAALLGRAVPDRLRRERPAASPSRRRCCRCCCPRSTTTRRRPSPTTTPTPRPSRRCRAPPSGRRSSWTWATGRRSTAARPTRCPTGPGPAGTTCATWTRATTTQMVDPELERYWLGPRGARRRRRRGPVRRRRRARRAAPAVRPLLAQGAARPGLRLQRGAVPPAGQPGLHLGLRLHRRARLLRARRRGRGEGRPVLLRGQAGQPRVREDRQEPEEHGHAGRDDRRVRGRHLPGLRDVDRAAGPVAAVGDQGRRRLAAAAAADLARGRRRGDRRGAGRRTSSRPRTTLRALHRTIAGVRDGFAHAAVQHRHRPDHRADQPPDADLRRDVAGAAVGGRAAGAAGGAAGPAHRRGAVGAAGPRRVAGLGTRSRSPTSAGWSTTPCRSPSRSTARCGRR